MKNMGAWMLLFELPMALDRWLSFSHWHYFGLWPFGYHGRLGLGGPKRCCLAFRIAAPLLGGAYLVILVCIKLQWRRMTRYFLHRNRAAYV